MEYDFRRRLESALTILRLWRRFRSAPASARRRSRLGFLVAAIAALTSLASGPPPLNGVDTLGLEDGAVIAIITGGVNPYLDAIDYESYISRDGGMSWSMMRDGPMYALIDHFQSADTPRGKYVIDGLGVARVEYGQRELVYSTEYLRGDANEWIQGNAPPKTGWNHRFLATHPRAIIYHPDSGNVIATMGIQGAAVETPDGRWHRVAVGPYAPTDFSFSAKTRTLMKSGWVVGGIALALSLSALAASAAASAYKYDMKRDGALVALASLGVLVAAGAVWAAANGAANSVWDDSLVLLSVELVAMLTSWTMILAIVASKSYGVAPHRYALLGCVAPLPIAFGLLLVFAFVGTYYVSYSHSAAAFRPSLTIAAAISLIPPLAYHARFIARHWRAFALAFLGMIALAALAFALWVYLNVSLAATQMAIVGLVGLAAVVLVRHVRGGLRADLPSAR